MRTTLLAALTAVSVGCAARPVRPTTPVKEVEMSAIEWPAEMTPRDCPVYVRNEITVDAPPAAVWRWLVAAERWPEWFGRASDVRVLEGGPALDVGARVRWRMLGANIAVTVRRAEPGRRLDWEGGAGGVHAYHAWVLQPLSDGRTRVITEETERGPVPSLLRWYLRRALHRAHQDWLEGLARVAVPRD
jgi:uncharacterized protein YndB with AHSA1/START domain